MAQKLKGNLGYILASILLFAAVGGFAYLNIMQNKSIREEEAKKAQVEFNTIIVHACEIYQLSEAQKLLGEEVEYEDTILGAESNKDIEISACSYSTPFRSAQELTEAKTSSVLIRAAKTSKGARANRAPFTDEKPTGVKEVTGYGSQAYWNPIRAQLNVYKDGNWLIFSVGSLDVNRRTLEETKKLADIVMPKI